MFSIKVGEKEYKVKFGYNSFCDTDLMDRTSKLIDVFQKAKTQDDSDVSNIGKIKDLFLCVRDLLFFGFQKYNPVETLQDVGNIIDDYHDGTTDDEKHDILTLFSKLSSELIDEGFLGELLTNQEVEAESKIQKIPQDHKKKQ